MLDGLPGARCDLRCTLPRLESWTTALIVSKAVKGYRRVHGIALTKRMAATGEIVKKMIWALTKTDLSCVDLIVRRR